MKDVKIQKAGAVCSLCGRPLIDVTRHPSILRWIAEHDRIETPPADPHDAPDETPPSPVADSGTADATSAPAPPANGAPSPSRVDVCPECWAKDHQLDYLCYWLARREPPKEKEKKDRKGRNAFLRELFYHYYNNEHMSAEDASSIAQDADDAPADDKDASAPADGKSPEEQERERDLHLYLIAHLLMRYKVFQWKGGKTDRKKRRWLQFDDPALNQTVKISDIDPADPDLLAVHQELADLLAE